MSKVVPLKTTAVLALASLLPRASPQAVPVLQPITAIQAAQLGPAVDLTSTEALLDHEKLDAPSRAAVLSLVERGALSEVDVRELTSHGKLARLKPVVRQVLLGGMLGASDGNPRPLLVSLNAHFLHLSDVQQLLALAYVQRNVTPRVVDVLGLKAYQALTPVEREQLMDRLAELSEDIRKQVAGESMVDSWLKHKTPAVLAQMHRLIDRLPVEDLTLEDFPVDLQKLPRAPYSMSDVQRAGPYEIQTMHIDGRRLTFQGPMGGHAQHGLHLPTVAQLAEAFAHVAPATRNEIAIIVLRPGRCPEDGKRGKLFKMKGFESVATVELTPEGREFRMVQIWATREPQSPVDLVKTLTHEGKHFWFLRASSAQVTAYTKALGIDLVSDSFYATRTLSEDVARTATRYELLRRQGLTPAGLSARFAVIRQIEAEDPGPGTDGGIVAGTPRN